MFRKIQSILAAGIIVGSVNLAVYIYCHLLLMAKFHNIANYKSAFSIQQHSSDMETYRTPSNNNNNNCLLFTNWLNTGSKPNFTAVIAEISYWKTHSKWSGNMSQKDLGLTESWLKQCPYKHKLESVLNNLTQFPEDDNLIELCEWFFTLRRHITYNDDFSRIIISSTVCLQNRKPFVLFLIPSTVDHVVERQIIRQSWASVAYGEKWPRDSRNFTDLVKVVFLIGIKRNTSPLHVLTNESNTYGDIVLADFVDSYRNLSLKMVVGLRWCSRHCSGARHVMKVDEDTIVDVSLLVDMLAVVSQHKRRFIIGRSNLNNNVHRHGKWAVTYNEYPLPLYPRYAIGHSYVLSQDAVTILSAITYYMPIVPNEDAYITGILAKTGAINRYNSDMFAGNVETNWCNALKSVAISHTWVKIPHIMNNSWNNFRFGVHRCKFLSRLLHAKQNK